jgi:hypothetical protein
MQFQLAFINAYLKYKKNCHLLAQLTSLHQNVIKVFGM